MLHLLFNLDDKVMLGLNDLRYVEQSKARKFYDMGLQGGNLHFKQIKNQHWICFHITRNLSCN